MGGRSRSLSVWVVTLVVALLVAGASVAASAAVMDAGFEVSVSVPAASSFHELLDGSTPSVVTLEDVGSSGSLEASLVNLYAVGGYDASVPVESFVGELDPRLRVELVPLVDGLARAVELRNEAFVDGELQDVGPMVEAGHVLVSAVQAQEEGLAELPASAWPTVKVADPVGLVAIGSLNDDTYTKSRWLQVDPAGDDRYENNAGGGKVLLSGVYHLEEINEYEIPAALSWDLAGDDVYDEVLVPFNAQGSGHRAVGVLVDEGGDDTYAGAREVQGTGFEGVGVFWDKGGNDSYSCSWGYCQGFATGGVGVFQDDWGDDSYFTEGAGLGATYFDGYASFEDGDGSDTYDADTDWVLGFTLEEGRAFFNDTGEDQDEYIFYQNTFAGNGMCWLQNQYATGVGHGQGCDDG